MENKKKDSDCIFCKISRGEIKSERILETENFFAVKDINPKTKGHSVLIFKKHYETFLDIPDDLFEEFMVTAKKLASKLMKEEKAEGFNLIMNNFRIAGQMIPHAHLHVLPRYKDDGFNANV